MKYIQEFNLPCYFYDCNRWLRTTAMLDLAQNIAGEASRAQGFSDSALAGLNCVWVLARMSFEYVKHPDFMCGATMQTWFREMIGPNFIRDFRLFDNKGDRWAKDTIKLVLINKETRHICRDEELWNIIPTTPQSDDAVCEGGVEKLVIPRGSELKDLGVHKVLYSDLDYNFHVNNVKYSQWAVDALFGNSIPERPIRKVAINFSNEATLHEDVLLQEVALSEDEHLISGVLPDGRLCFVEKLCF